jgi:hypothetical protein
LSVRVLPAFDLEAQIRSDGATWLDRQLVGRDRAQPVDGGFGQDVIGAKRRRVQVLIAQGFAERQGELLNLNRETTAIRRLQDARVSLSQIRQLIRMMSLANPLWGVRRIHGELLQLGISIGQTSVAKYIARRRGLPSQGWRTFLRNHADGIAAMDLFVVPTISFRLLYGLLTLRHDRVGFCG